jgi:RNA polymerase sigma-70 factor (ECF subfamily)
LEQEFLQSVKEHQGIILKICRLYCSENLDAEDLYQEILLQLWKSWPAYHGTAKVSTWMYQVGLNTAITWVRKNKRQPVYKAISLVPGSVKEMPTQRLDILFDQELQAALNGLDKIDKALIMLYLDEKSYKEIAEIMGLSENNVGVKINRIKKKLKEKIMR